MCCRVVVSFNDMANEFAPTEIVGAILIAHLLIQFIRRPLRLPLPFLTL